MKTLYTQGLLDTRSPYNFAYFFRSSGHSCSLLHVLSINPIFSRSIDSKYEMLNPQCSSMSEVIRYGLNSEKCYEMNLFSLHVNINYLIATNRSFDDFRDMIFLAITWPQPYARRRKPPQFQST